MGILEAITMQNTEKAREEERIHNKSEFVINLLMGSDFNVAKIAAVAGVTEEFVLQIKQETGKQ